MSNKKYIQVRIPCQDCIVLPMCLARTRNKFTVMSYLKLTCAIFEDYSVGFQNVESLKQVFEIFGIWNPKKHRREHRNEDSLY